MYALALVLVEATTGTVPFAADTTLGTLMARIERPVSAPAATGPLAPVIESAGRVDPRARLDAAGLARALDAIAAAMPPPAPLPLASPFLTGLFERDASPTEVPGRPRLFDQADVAEFDVAEFDVDEAAPEAATRPGRPNGATSTQRTASPDGPAAMAAPAQADTGDSTHASALGATPEPAPPPRRRRRWLRRLAILVVVLLLAAGGTAAALAATGSLRPTHPVPNLARATRSQADGALTRLHLHLATLPSVYSPTIVAGSVVTQRPAPGVRVKEGSTVSVVLSRGPQPVNVPNLHGLTVGQATAVLTNVGLKLNPPASAYDMTVPINEIISSKPAGGTLLPGQAVTVTVSAGKPFVSVPTLSGPSAQTFAAAKAALAQVGLGAVETDAFSNAVPKLQVMSTNPPAGTRQRVGTVITVVISKGPDLVPVPTVQGDSVTGAAQMLTSYGFSVSGVTGNPTAQVTGTDPQAGALLLRGSSVQIVTG